jgi:hypothetical protein
MDVLDSLRHARASLFGTELKSILHPTDEKGEDFFSAEKKDGKIILSKFFSDFLRLYERAR